LATAEVIEFLPSKPQTPCVHTSKTEKKLKEYTSSNSQNMSSLEV
jgi:hypothetical protein